mmetsp:Transcript_17378/g.58244  ORF Transcript_17378/g.58244 Transcript_17378/m.58244 type:complete len:237 (-) Transcript_17378:496-1206(-)
MPRCEKTVARESRRLAKFECRCILKSVCSCRTRGAKTHSHLDVVYHHSGIELDHAVLCLHAWHGLAIRHHRILTIEDLLHELDLLSWLEGGHSAVRAALAAERVAQTAVATVGLWRRLVLVLGLLHLLEPTRAILAGLLAVLRRAILHALLLRERSLGGLQQRVLVHERISVLGAVVRIGGHLHPRVHVVPDRGGGGHGLGRLPAAQRKCSPWSVLWRLRLGHDKTPRGCSGLLQG